jgi:MFS family permease
MSDASHNPSAITAVLAFAGTTASFMGTIVVPIQSQLPVLLDSPRSSTAWVLTVTLLSACILTPISGRLADLYGKRLLAILSLLTLVVGSIIAALSIDVWTLIAGRALQGAVFGIIPLGISILRDTLPPSRVPAAVALVSSSLGVGGAVGLPLSALVAESLDWHLLFWVAASLGVLDIALVWRFVPESTSRAGGRFDWLGAITLALSLFGILVTISQGADRGWLSAPILAAGIGGVAFLLLFGLRQVRTPSPLVNLRIAARPTVLFTNLASVAIAFSYLIASVTLPQVLQLPSVSGFGLTLITASFVLVPSGLAMMATSPMSARLAARVGARTVLICGALLIALSYAMAILFSTELWQIALVNISVGVGVGMGYASMPALIMGAVPASATAAANGLNALMRTVGMTASAAVVATVLAHETVPGTGGLVPTIGAFHLTYFIGICAAAVSIAFALFIPVSRFYRRQIESPSKIGP